jgi:hypothetical protein
VHKRDGEPFGALHHDQTSGMHRISTATTTDACGQRC